MGLVCSYGKQLKSIDPIVVGIREELLRKISDHCPNTSSLGFLFASDPKIFLNIFGSQMRFLWLTRDVPEWTDLGVCFSKCFNEKVVRIPFKNASVFFATPKPSLEDLLLLDVQNVHEHQDIARIAKNSGGLRVIDVSGSRKSRQALQKLALSNKFVEEVSVEVYGHASDDSLASYMIDHIDCFFGLSIPQEDILDFLSKCRDFKASCCHREMCTSSSSKRID